MRSRNIKPAFFKNEDLADVDHAARLLFIGLWCLADKNGVIEYRPKRIKAEIFPYEPEIDVNGYITVLSRLGFIRVLVGDDREWLLVDNFTVHQNPHHTEKTKNPDPNSLKEKDSGDLTGTSPLSTGDTPADSLLLIPDSLNTDSLKEPSSSTDEGEVYLTKKNRKLKGDQLTWFKSFWSAFSYTRGKADAADAWLDLKVTEQMGAEIITGAAAEAAGRGALLADNRTPKMAQGWLSGRRWEDGAGGIVDATPWYKTAPGIKAKGLELGIKEDDFDMFPDFRAAVLQAAGHDPSLVR